MEAGESESSGSMPKEERSTSRRRSEEGVCTECRAAAPIYQCPGCMIRTCSLACVQGHKKRTECSGKRNRGEFVPMNRMTDGTMRSDYFFLEEVLEQIPRSGKRAKTLEGSSQNKSKKFRRLLQQAEKRGTSLQLMPSMMVRHKTNTSWYCAPKDTITWKVEVVVHPSKATTSFNLSEHEEDLMGKVSSHCTKEKITIPTGENSLFLMKLPRTEAGPRYAELDPMASLKTALRGMSLIEHPTIHLVPNDIREKFPTGTDKITEVDPPQATDES